MKIAGLICGVFAGIVTSAAVAQEADEKPSQRQMMLAAGYKAMFTCSALFNADKSLEQIAGHELDHIYPDYEPAMALLPDAVIDHNSHSVSVFYDENFPPRVSRWRGNYGCTAEPPGGLHDGSVEREILIAGRHGADSLFMEWPADEVIRKESIASDDQLLSVQQSVTRAFSGEFAGRTTAVIVVQGGQIVHEKYIDGFDEYTSQRTWSVAKSIAATVIGAAVHQGILDVEDPTGLEEWSRSGDPRQEITIENLLHMASGLDSGLAGNRTDDIYFGGGLVAQHATKGALEAEPGTRWKYANNDTMLVMRSLRNKIEDEDVYRYFPFGEVLFKIDMFDTSLETDWGGDYVMSSQVWTTARDLARLGILYLNDGVWDGERILPKGWAKYVSTPAPAQPPCRGENGCRQYGAQFWLYKGYPGVPDDTYAALGNRGQFLIIVPSRDVVIVRRGYDWRGNYFDGPAFAADVLKALE